MRKIVFAIFLLALSAGCQHTKLTIPNPLPPEEPVVVTPVPEKPVVKDPAMVEAMKAKVMAVTLGSKCAKTAHDVQGTPPKSYLRGIALTYTRMLCHKEGVPYKTASRPIGNASTDALAHYGIKTTNPDLIVDTLFSMILGSGARESSWRWCVGKDPGAKNTTGETCEAGLYQTSWNSRSASPELEVLYWDAKESDESCFAAEYKGSTTCSEANMKNWGTGEGVEFQKRTKECPGFATEYHAMMLRMRRSHYGPINRYHTSLKSECTSMFSDLRQVIVNDPSICQAF